MPLVRLGGVSLLFVLGTTMVAVRAEDAPWSFKPVTRPAVPAVRDQAWPRDDLDRFVLHKLEAAAIAPNPMADRRALIRRASFDLTGLPPTPEDVEAFVSDPAADDAAFTKVVDRLLASPRFGERWARHWLDVARYADSVGRSWNAPFTYAWRYRDYVIDSFNADKPYDRFVLEQLAGDLLPARSIAEEREQKIATGFLAVGSVPIQEGTHEQFVLDRVDDQIDATTQAFLGLTIACARCHNHKTDPITMRDYYALAGVFYSTRTKAGQGTHSRDDGSQDYVDGNLLLRLPREKGSSLAKPAANEIHTMTEFRTAWQVGPRDAIRYTFDPDRAMGVLDSTARDCAVRVKGDPRDTRPAPPRGDVRIPGLPVPAKVPVGASGRLEIARWIAAPENPLTARVMVNRVWLHLFGQGLVPTPGDFGSTGEEPTHPELLDHLASRFVADGWSVKKLIRALMLSRTYRLSSGGRAEGRTKDPGNTLYGRASLRRLELEPIRDSLLLAAGWLTFDRPPGIPVSGTGGKGRNMGAYSLLPVHAPYRSIYLPVLRSLLPDVYGTFDFPDPCSITGRRDVTTVAPQALFFLNSPFVAECSRGAAELALKQPGLAEPERVRRVYRRLLSRPPSEEELADALRLLASASSKAPESWAVLTQALMASAEFRYVP